MAGSGLTVLVITPDGEKVNSRASMVIMRATTGLIGIMPGHEPLSAVLDFGVLRIMDGDADEQRLAIFGGVAQIRKDMLVILTGRAETARDFDLEQAYKQKAELEQQLLENDEDEAECERIRERMRYPRLRILFGEAG